MTDGDSLLELVKKSKFGVAFDKYLKLYTYDEVELHVEDMVNQKFAIILESDPKKDPVIFPICRYSLEEKDIEVTYSSEYSLEAFECMRDLMAAQPKITDFKYKEILIENQLIGERDQEILERRNIVKKQKDEEEKDKLEALKNKKTKKRTGVQLNTHINLDFLNID